MVGDILIHDARELCWRRLGRPQAVLTTSDLAQIRPLLAEIERRIEQEQFIAVGFLTYEAAPAFDPALITHPAQTLPLLWFGLYDSAELITLPTSDHQYEIGNWHASIDADQFHNDIAQIKSHIAKGETYQVNHTFRLNAPFAGDPLSFFLDLQAAQNGLYGAYIDGGDWAICSASPELFFTLDGTRLESRPMKGTAARGLSWQDDVTQIDWLRRSEKNRAENVMIVDMIRNDMGRIAEVGSVHVPSLFDVSRYPTVLQMTSTVRAETNASLGEIMAALFPCASITGAPKVRTMEIINELEQTPRGAYCGAIGMIRPNRQAQFNVAIRTVTIAGGSAEYGTGRGIVWDSEPADEYRESLLKAQVLTTRRPPFSLLETMLATNGAIWLLDEHLTRLANSAGYFDYPLDMDALRLTLTGLAASLKEHTKLRLLLARSGELTIETHPISETSGEPMRLGVATRPIQSTNPFLYHKTTIREMYTQAETDAADVDDILLYNERGEITETTIANVLFYIEGAWVTPPIASGLLGGTLREHLLASGEISEQIVRLDQLGRVEDVAVINSVRGWRSATVV